MTRPHLPPLAEVTRLLEGVWERRILTNGGPLHQQLEEELAAYLGVEHLSLFANGTLALLVALKALRLRGEVITTPFSFVATSEALSWNGLEPVFADIQEGSYGLDPATDGAPTADPDGDGYDNSLEFAFGTNPTVGTPALLSATRSGANISVTFVRLIGSASATYVVQSSSNLSAGPWSPTGITPTTAGVDQTGVPAGYERVGFTALADGNAFYRVVATVSAQ